MGDLAEVTVRRVAAVIKSIRVRTDRRVLVAAVDPFRELDELARPHGFGEVRRPVEDDDRLLVRLSRGDFSPERGGRTGVDHGEVHAERLDTLLTVLQPVNGAIEIAALVAGLRRGEEVGAVVQRLPRRQAGAGVLGPHRIPPVLTRHRVMGARVDHAAFGERGAVGRAERAFPDFQLKRHVAEANRFINRLAVRGDELDIAAHRFEDLAEGVAHHDLAGPVVDGNDDRIVTVRGEGRHRGERDGARREGLRELHFVVSLLKRGRLIDAHAGSSR